MRTQALGLVVCALSALACGEYVELGRAGNLSTQPREISLEGRSAPDLVLTARSASADEFIRIPMSCTGGEPAACPGYESRLWVDAGGVWLANIADDRRTLQLAHLSLEGQLLASARWTEPDPFRTVREPSLWRADNGGLHLALLQDGCDLQQTNGQTFCVAASERVRVLSVSDSLSVTVQDTFSLEPGFRTTRIVSSAAGAALLSEIAYNQPVAGGRHHIRVQRLAADGARAPSWTLRADLSYPYTGRSAAIDADGRIGIVLDSGQGRAYAVDADGRRAEDAIFVDPGRMLDATVLANGHLLLMFRAALGFELVDLEREAHESMLLGINAAGLFGDMQLYVRHMRTGANDIVELLFLHYAPEGGLFCRIARKALKGTCLDLGVEGELWDLHTSAFGTWIAVGGTLLGVRPSLALASAP
jgi:hypothetical protein